MPVLQISAGDGRLLDLAPWVVLATMVYPNSVDDQVSLIAPLWAQNLVNVQTDDAPIPIPRSILRELIHAPALGEAVQRAMEEAKFEGAMAGKLLLYILTAAGTEPKHASVGKGIELLARVNIRQGLPASRRSISTAWSRFKSVSHLWAAAAYWMDVTIHHLPEDQLDIRWYFLSDETALLTVLALAEDLRRKGESYHPPRQKQPLLDPKIMWNVPSDIELRGMTVPSGQLSDWAQKVLADYKAER